MSAEKIKTYPEITSIIIEGDSVKSLIQEYYDIDKVKTHIQGCINIVRSYDKKGYYNLVKPDFVGDVITTFSNLELTKKDVMRVNNFMKISGFEQCNRIWQLPDEMKAQASQMLDGFYITYDSDNWESFSIKPIKG